MSVDKMENEQDQAAAAAEPDILAAIAAERDQFAAEKADLQDRLLRTQAEFQNQRKRTERERVELFEYASMEAVARPASDP